MSLLESKLQEYYNIMTAWNFSKTKKGMLLSSYERKSGICVVLCVHVNQGSENGVVD